MNCIYYFRFAKMPLEPVLLLQEICTYHSLHMQQVLFKVDIWACCFCCFFGCFGFCCWTLFFVWGWQKIWPASQCSSRQMYSSFYPFKLIRPRIVPFRLTKAVTKGTRMMQFSKGCRSSTTSWSLHCHLTVSYWVSVLFDHLLLGQQVIQI